jgi:hypothetical protein
MDGQQDRAARLLRGFERAALERLSRRGGDAEQEACKQDEGSVQQHVGVNTDGRSHRTVS